VIAVGAVLLVAGGPGRFGADDALTTRRRATVDA
jgi:hypothetical protein